MIGGSSIPQPAFVPGYGQPYQPAAPQQYSTADLNRTRTALPKARVRMQMEEPQAASPRPQEQPLQMSSPEKLGVIAKKRTDEVNWDEVRQRLQRLKVASFHLQKLPNGQGFRFICALPGGPGRQVNAEASTEAEAIDQALAQVEIMQ